MSFADSLFWLVVAGVVAYFVFNIFRRGGLTGAFFNAQIADTVGEVDAIGPTLVSRGVKVHTLERDGEVLVGVAITSKTVMSYEILPLVLSPRQAKQLAVLLQTAAGRKP